MIFGGFDRYEPRSNGCIVTRAGSVSCWPFGGPIASVRGTERTTAIAVAPTFACAVRDGEIFCWGAGRAVLVDSDRSDVPVRIALPPT